MPALAAIAYASSSVGILSEAALETLLVDARAHNAEEEVTGVLLYDDGTFFQYFEGPEDGVDRIYTRIKASSQHRSIIELFRNTVDSRNFGTWEMGFSRAPRAELLRLAQASWDAAMVAGHPPPHGIGVQLLKTFWELACRRKIGTR